MSEKYEHACEHCDYQSHSKDDMKTHVEQQHAQSKKKTHGELLADGSYHCCLKWDDPANPDGIACQKRDEQQRDALRQQIALLTAATDKYETELAQWRRRADTMHASLVELLRFTQYVREIVDARLTDVALAALSFAAIHISNEADLFEDFCDARLARAQRFDSATGVIKAEKSGGSNGLRSLAIQLRDKGGAIAELRARVEHWQQRRGSQEAQGQPKTPIEPQTGSQTPSPRD